MANLDEISRLIGQMESSIQILFHKQDEMSKELKCIHKLLQKRRFWDSIKIVTAAFAGGFSAIIAKMIIWK
jgi:hypothetical protein